MFITFCQNSSGGYHFQDENVDVFVIIEGDSLEEILNKAKSIFKDYRRYCLCCGERWDDDDMSESDLDEEPMIFDESVYECKCNDFWERAIIYRKNGEKEVVNFKK